MTRQNWTPVAQRAAAELRGARGFLRSLGPFVGRSDRVVGPPGASDLGERERRFTDIIDRAVLQRPESPYARLLAWAGIGAGDLRAMLAAGGLDRTLSSLCDAGVYVTLEEFKGWRPLTRPGLELPLSDRDFDNPLLDEPYTARTGGSGGASRSVALDLALLDYESRFHRMFYEAAGLTGRPLAIWHPAPPGAVGLKTALIQARLDWPAERWFSQSRSHWGSLRHALFTRAAVRAARGRVPRPVYTPPREAATIGQWLAERRASGGPGILVTTPSGCVRVCRAALDGGLEIAGSFFVLVGEPFTTAKADLVAATGARAASHYAMTETGLIGVACQAAHHPDDVHLLDDKVATIQRPRLVGTPPIEIGALHHTTLLPSSPKLMLNVESGDFAVREGRSCGCRAVPGGLGQHLHTIRSYEKLTSEGMNFLGGDLVTLIEEFLPQRFGGGPTDYQLVEREQDGLPRVALIIRPSVGPLDADRVLEAVLSFLRQRGSGHEMMTRIWAQSGTLRVVREEPHETPSGKVPTLQTLID